MDTLYTFWDNTTHYKTKSVHFFVAYELSNLDFKRTFKFQQPCRIPCGTPNLNQPQPYKPLNPQTLARKPESQMPNLNSEHKPYKP